MRGILPLVLLVLGLAADAATAQTRVFPKNFFWKRQTVPVPPDPCAPAASPGDPNFSGISKVSAFNTIDLSPLTVAVLVANGGVASM